MKHLFGPVPSRRLGSSLGVDLVPAKTCSFDCVYCQLGRTTNKTDIRTEYVSISDTVSEIRHFLSTKPMVDYITLSGSGEPTLNSGTGKLIREVKKFTDIPVAVLTNASLIGNPDVRRELSYADLVLPSLDAATQRTFERINRPVPGIRVNDIADGLAHFRAEFGGKIWLEIMLVEGVNDSQTEIGEMKKAIWRIKPDKVQLNTVVRPPAEESAHSLREEEMKEIAEVLGAEVIAEFKRKGVAAYSGNKEEDITELLKRRPCTISDISSALGLHENEVLKYMEVLLREYIIKRDRRRGKEYFRVIV